MVGNYLKKRLVIFLGSFVFILACGLIVYSSKYSSAITNDLVVEENGLKIVYQDLLNGVNTSLYPMSMDDGLISSPANVIKIINKGKKKKEYSVYIDIKKDDNSLDENKIYFSVNDLEPKILGSINDNKIYSDVVGGKMEDIIDIKIWAGSDLVDNNDSGKTISLDIKVK